MPRPNDASRGRPPEPEAEARAERRARSIEEPLDVRVLARAPYPRLEVRNPIHRTAYVVMLPEYPAPAAALCTCTDYARRGLGTCKHIEAGLRWLRGRPDPGPAEPPYVGDATWAEIDRRLAELPSPERLRARLWARPGAALYD